jgi:hypothetical protein
MFPGARAPSPLRRHRRRGLHRVAPAVAHDELGPNHVAPALRNQFAKPTGGCEIRETFAAGKDLIGERNPYDGEKNDQRKKPEPDQILEMKMLRRLKIVTHKKGG